MLHKSKDDIDKCDLSARIINVRVLDLRDHLDLIDEYVVLLMLIRDTGPDKPVKLHWVSVSSIGELIKSESYDLFRPYTLLEKMVTEKLKQQHGFPASSKTRNDLYTTVPL